MEVSRVSGERQNRKIGESTGTDICRSPEGSREFQRPSHKGGILDKEKKGRAPGERE